MSQENEATAKDALWAQLQEIQRKEMEAVKLERERLEEEKRSMNALDSDSSDVISINAGGEVILQAHRDTLCFATGSVFANLFSGRWEDSCARDDQGRVFLDHDPEFIRLIVNHLRIKKMEDPGNPVPAPSIPADKRPAFLSLLRYFGLLTFFYPVGLLVPDLEIVANPECLFTTQHSDGSFRLSCKKSQNSQGLHDGQGGYLYKSVSAWCTPPLTNDANTHCFWKCTLSSKNEDITMGVISNLHSTKGPDDPTCFAWRKSNQTIVAGQPTTSIDGWSTFSEGEELWFRLAGRKLTMYSMKKNREFSIDGVPENPFIYFFFDESEEIDYPGTELILAALYASERSSIGW